MEKSEYYCRYYLKQIIKYLDFVLDSVFAVPVTPSNSNPIIDCTNSNSNQPLATTTSATDQLNDKQNKASEVNPVHIANVTRFISDVLEILFKLVAIARIKSHS
jgi:hypothetical protein